MARKRNKRGNRPAHADNVELVSPKSSYGHAKTMRKALGYRRNDGITVAMSCQVENDGALNLLTKEVVPGMNEKQYHTRGEAVEGRIAGREKDQRVVVDVCKERHANADFRNAWARELPVSQWGAQDSRAISEHHSAATARSVSTLTQTSTYLNYGRLQNIDKPDIGNQFAVVDYVEDIYMNYREAEMHSCVPPDYMSWQVDINHEMRALVVNWFIEVNSSINLKPEVLFLATNLLDRYLSRVSIPRTILHLVGGTAMLLAAKYEGMTPNVKTQAFNKMVCIFGDVYSKNDMIEMEKVMLRTLDYNLAVPTPYVFILRFLKAASSDKQMERLVFFLAELCLHEYVMLEYPPSLLAAAAVYTAHHTLRRRPCWTPTLFIHSGYTEAELKICSQMMVKFHRQANVGVPLNVHRKYWSVATLAPAVIP